MFCSKRRQVANIEYYKASGICSGFDLLALFALDFLAISILSMPSVALLCYQENSGWKIFALCLPFLTAWFNGWLAMVLVKNFKMRAPGLVFCVTLAAGILGLFCVWGGVWLLGQSDLEFVKFVNTANLKTVNAQGAVLWLGGAFCLIIVLFPTLQAARPFNEEHGRWFKRKGSKPFKVYYNSWNEFYAAIYGESDLIDFFRGYGYGMTSHINFLFNFTFSWLICKMWFYYDKNAKTCYLTGMKNEAHFGLPLIRHRAISRSQAKFLYRLLA